MYPGRVLDELYGAPTSPNVLIREKSNGFDDTGSRVTPAEISLHVSVQVSIAANESLTPNGYSTSTPSTNAADGFKNLSL